MLRTRWYLLITRSIIARYHIQRGNDKRRVGWASYVMYHDDVIKWKHFPGYWPFVRGIQWSPLALWEGNPIVTGALPSQKPVMRSFDIFFDVRLNKRQIKQSRCRWFETPSCRHCNVFEHFGENRSCYKEFNITPMHTPRTWLLKARLGTSTSVWTLGAALGVLFLGVPAGS